MTLLEVQAFPDFWQYNCVASLILFTGYHQGLLHLFFIPKKVEIDAVFQY